MANGILEFLDQSLQNDRKRNVLGSDAVSGVTGPTSLSSFRSNAFSAIGMLTGENEVVEKFRQGKAHEVSNDALREVIRMGMGILDEVKDPIRISDIGDIPPEQKNRIARARQRLALNPGDRIRIREADIKFRNQQFTSAAAQVRLAAKELFERTKDPQEQERL